MYVLLGQQSKTRVDNNYAEGHSTSCMLLWLMKHLLARCLPLNLPQGRQLAHGGTPHTLRKRARQRNKRTATTTIKQATRTIRTTTTKGGNDTGHIDGDADDNNSGDSFMQM